MADEVTTAVGMDTNKICMALSTTILFVAAAYILSLSFNRNKCTVPNSKLSVRDIIHLMSSKASPMHFFEESLKLGKVFRISMPRWKPFVLCMDTQVSKEILQDATSDKPDLYKFVEVPRGCPILVSKKTKGIGENSWAAERKAFAPCFAKNQYNFSNAKDQLAKLDLFLEATICDDDGNLRNVSRMMCQYTIDAFAKSAYGIEMNALGGPPDSLGNIFLVCLFYH